MMLQDQSLQFKNVVWKGYRVIPEEIEIALSDFTTLIEQNGIEKYHFAFFSIESPLDEDVYQVTCFAQIDDRYMNIKSEDLCFLSYWSVKNLLLCRIAGDFYENSQKVYGEMLEFIETENLVTTTPFFNVIKRVNENSYIEVYIGVEKKE